MNIQRDSTYYIYPNFQNPLLRDPYYYNDAMNLLSDIDSFQSIYIQYHNCAMVPSSSSSSNTNNNNVDENDYWYIGATPIPDAQITFTIYGVKKGDNRKRMGCHRSTFINSFYTSDGISSFLSALSESGLSNGNDGTIPQYTSSSSSSTCHIQNNVGYGVSCSNTNDRGGKNDKYNFVYNQYPVVTSSYNGMTNAICTPDSVVAVVDTMDSMNDLLRSDTMNCYEIYNANTDSDAGTNANSSPIQTILTNSHTCQTMYDPLVQRYCPDPYHIIQHRDEQLVRAMIDHVQYRDKYTQQQEVIQHTSIIVFLIAAGIFILVTTFLIYHARQNIQYYKQQYKQRRQRQRQKQKRDRKLQKVQNANAIWNRTIQEQQQTPDDNDKHQCILSPTMTDDDTTITTTTTITSGTNSIDNTESSQFGSNDAIATNSPVAAEATSKMFLYISRNLLLYCSSYIMKGSSCTSSNNNSNTSLPNGSPDQLGSEYTCFDDTNVVELPRYTDTENVKDVPNDCIGIVKRSKEETTINEIDIDHYIKSNSTALSQLPESIQNDETKCRYMATPERATDERCMGPTTIIDHSDKKSNALNTTSLNGSPTSITETFPTTTLADGDGIETSQQARDVSVHHVVSQQTQPLSPSSLLKMLRKRRHRLHSTRTKLHSQQQSLADAMTYIPPTLEITDPVALPTRDSTGNIAGQRPFLVNDLMSKTSDLKANSSQTDASISFYDGRPCASNKSNDKRYTESRGVCLRQEEGVIETKSPIENSQVYDNAALHPYSYGQLSNVANDSVVGRIAAEDDDDDMMDSTHSEMDEDMFCQALPVSELTGNCCTTSVTNDVKGIGNGEKVMYTSSTPMTAPSSSQSFERYKKQITARRYIKAVGHTLIQSSTRSKSKMEIGQSPPPQLDAGVVGVAQPPLLLGTNRNVATSISMDDDNDDIRHKNNNSKPVNVQTYLTKQRSRIIQTEYSSRQQQLTEAHQDGSQLYPPPISCPTIVEARVGESKERPLQQNEHTQQQQQQHEQQHPMNVRSYMKNKCQTSLPMTVPTETKHSNNDEEWELFESKFNR